MKTILTVTVFAVVSIIGAVVGIAVDRSWSQNSVVAIEPSHLPGGDVRSVHALGSIQPSGGVIEVAVPAGLRRAPLW